MTQVVESKAAPAEVMYFGPELKLPKGKWVSPAGNVIRVSDKARMFIQSYVGPAKWNASKAAEMAGYTHVGTQGPALAKKFREVIDWWILEHQARLVIGPQECLELLAEIARSPKHKDQIRAIELAMRAHGMLSEKLLITTDRKALEAQVVELARALAARVPAQIVQESQGPIIDVEPIEIPQEEAPVAVASTSGDDES